MSESLLFENQNERMALSHHVLNLAEAAFYCRCSVETIKYHALRSKKLVFCDFTKSGPVFLKTDLDAFLKLTRKCGKRHVDLNGG